MVVATASICLQEGFGQYCFYIVLQRDKGLGGWGKSISRNSFSQKCLGLYVQVVDVFDFSWKCAVFSSKKP